MENLRLKNSFVQIVVRFQFKIAPSTGKTLLNLNASFAAIQRNGSVGETLISASLAIKGNAMEIMLVSSQKSSYQSAMGQANVQPEAITMAMGMKEC